MQSMETVERGTLDDPDAVQTPPSVACSRASSDASDASEGFVLDGGEDAPTLKEAKSPSDHLHIINGLYAIWKRARYAKYGTDMLRGIVRVVRRHVQDLQGEIIALQNDLERQERATEVVLIDKENDVRVLRSELSALRVVADARAASLATLEVTVRQLAEEKEMAEREAMRYAQEVQNQNFKKKELEEELQNVQNELLDLKEKHSVATARLKAAQADAADAAEQLAEACDENAKMAETLLLYEEEIELWKERSSELEKREMELLKEIDALSASNEIARQRTPLGREEQGLLLLAHGDKRSENERSSATDKRANMRFSEGPSAQDEAKHARISDRQLIAASTTINAEDILAVEMTSLRNRNAELEAQMSEQAHDIALIGALRQENASLRAAAEKSALDAEKAQHELRRVQRDAQALHAHLSHAISAAGLSDLPLKVGFSPVEVGETLFKDANHGRYQHTKPPTTTRVNSDLDCSPHVEGRTYTYDSGHLANDRLYRGEAENFQSNDSRLSPASSSHGPTTPTSMIPSGPAHSMKVPRPSSDTSCDSVLADLRAAMLSLDVMGSHNAQHTFQTGGVRIFQNNGETLLRMERLTEEDRGTPLVPENGNGNTRRPDENCNTIQESKEEDVFSHLDVTSSIHERADSIPQHTPYVDSRTVDDAEILHVFNKLT